MLKRNITGEEIFNINNIINNNVSMKKYKGISDKLGYPFNYEIKNNIKQTHQYKNIEKSDYPTANDYSLHALNDSRKISNDIVYKKKYNNHPLFYDLFPSVTKEIKIDLQSGEIDDIIQTPKKISLSVYDHVAVENGVENMTEEERIIKKMTEDNIIENKDDTYYENFLQDYLNKKYAVVPTPVIPTPIVPTPIVPTPIVPPALPIPIVPTTLPLPPTIPTLAITAPSLAKKVSQEPSLKSITPEMLKGKILQPIKSSSSMAASSASNIVTTDVFDITEPKQSGKSIVSQNPNLIVEDMKHIHPLVYEKITDILRKSAIGGKIDDDMREEVNNLLQSYQKGKLSSGTWHINTVLRQFANRFMKATNTPTKSKKNKSNTPVKLTEDDLFSITPTKSN